MKKILIFLFIIISLPTFAQKLNAIYILSEGGFSAGSSLISKLALSENYFNPNIFNPGNIGLYPDGLIYHNNYLYITEQGNFGGSGKIYKIDTSGTVINSAEFGTNPYSLTITNEKVYITNGPTGMISVLSLNDFSKIKEIKVGVYPQEIISYGNKVFVANNSLWGGDSDSTVSVIDSESDEIIDTIVVKKDPSSLAIFENYLFVGCPGQNNEGVIFKVDLNTFIKVDSFMISDYGFGKDISISNNENKLFFKSFSNKIIELNLTTKEYKILIDDNNILYVYGYGYDYISGNHYLLDAKDFASNGSLNIYNSDGVLQNNYQTGIAPRRVVFEYDSVTVNVYKDIMPNNFYLYQNYPNPFNPSTTINYQIKETGNVSIKIYDALGREITTLVNEIKQPGNYSVTFKADNHSSGIYFVRMQANEYRATRKIILAK